LDLGVIQELVEKSGSWYSFSGERIGQGRETARAFLIENPAVADKLDADLRRRLELTPAVIPIPTVSEQLEILPADRSKTARTA